MNMEGRKIGVARVRQLDADVNGGEAIQASEVGKLISLRATATGRLVAVTATAPLDIKDITQDEFAPLGLMDWKRRRKRVQYMRLRFNPSYRGPIVLAEGDSWYEFPRADDLIDVAGKKVAILSLAKAGDSWPDIIHQEGQYYPDDSTPMGLLDTAAREQPTIVMLSVGGNDFLPNIKAIVEKFDQSLPIADLVRWDDLNLILDTILANYENYCRLLAPTPIVLHTYDYPDPREWGDGGQWIGGPLMRHRKFPGLGPCRAVVNEMVDHYAARLQQLVSRLRQLGLPVVLLDYRGTIGTRHANGPSPQLWADELHASNDGAKLLAAKMVDLLNAIHDGTVPLTDMAAPALARSDTPVAAKGSGRRKKAAA